MKIRTVTFVILIVGYFNSISLAYNLGIGTNEAMAGTTIRIPVSITVVSNVASIHLKVNYDPRLLNLQIVTNSTGTIGEQYEMQYVIEDGSIDVVLVRDEGLSSVEGVLVNMDFIVNQGAIPGMSSALTIARQDVSGTYGGETQEQEGGRSSGRLWVVYSSLVDSDNDGLNDYQEQMLNGSPDYLPGKEDTFIDNADSDGDGVPDGWEVVYGLNPCLNDAAWDSDGDGLSNYEEWVAGTDPKNPLSAFMISEASFDMGSSGFVINWNANLGKWYSVYSASNLLEPIWITNLYRRQSLSTGKMSYTNADGDNTRFFRIGIENQ
jgi:hypothetical protein